jgi:hypothetical protein
MESNVKGISVRAIITILIVLTTCILSVLHQKVDEPLYTLVISAVSFYFGSNMKSGETPKQ